MIDQEELLATSQGVSASPPRHRRWVMRQDWERLLFVHWPVSMDELRPLIPKALEIDTFESQAWLGLVPFHLRIRLRYGPPMPWVFHFPELNVRTYVRYGGKRGIYFLRLYAPGRVAVTGGRLCYRLPYVRASMNMRVRSEGVRFSSYVERNEGRHAEFIASYAPIGDVVHSRHGSLDYWLTERYHLFTTDAACRLFGAEVWHDPWPLQNAEADIESNSLPQAHGISQPQERPLLHYARRLDTWVGPLERLS